MNPEHLAEHLADSYETATGQWRGWSYADHVRPILAQHATPPSDEELIEFIRLSFFVDSAGQVYRRRLTGYAGHQGLPVRCKGRRVRYKGRTLPLRNVAWCLHYGELPATAIGLRDGDPANCSRANLTTERTPRAERRAVEPRPKRLVEGRAYYDAQGRRRVAVSATCAVCSVSLARELGPCSVAMYMGWTCSCLPGAEAALRTALAGADGEDAKRSLMAEYEATKREANIAREA